MTREQIEMLNGKVITEEQLEEIELCEEVVNVECLGTSGLFVSCEWFSVEFMDGESIDVYLD